MEVRGRFADVSSLLLSHGCQVLILGYQAWQRALLPTVPSHRPKGLHLNTSALVVQELLAHTHLLRHEQLLVLPLLVWASRDMMLCHGQAVWAVS